MKRFSAGTLAVLLAALAALPSPAGNPASPLLLAARDGGRDRSPRDAAAARSACIMNIRNVQQAVRSFQNMNGRELGSPIPWKQIIGPDKFLERWPKCHGGGIYTLSRRIPKVGELACRCSHQEERNHVPTNHKDW